MSSVSPHSDARKAAAADSHVGRSAVEARLATAEELRACIKKQAELKAGGRDISLTDVLVKTGVITKSQLKRLLNPSDDSASGSLQQIPGFQLKQKVGAGAMASVYKARQLSLDRIVAIKVLPKRLSEDPEFVERFYKEGKAAAKLNHNNIVQAIDVGEYAGYHYFVMEFVDGQTIYDELVKSRVYDESAALDVIIQIAEALEHAHTRGLIHRDVKPKNIMIAKGGVAKLADMGLARQADDAAAAEAEKGRAFGTPYYIAPEQIRGVVDVDGRADIYSLGATFYNMVTGKVPFEGPTPTAIMQKHLKQPLVPPDHINRSLSTGLAEVIERMMMKNRDQRYGSLTDVLMDLACVQRGEAPRQARSGVDDSLLETLADGDEDPDAASWDRSVDTDARRQGYGPPQTSSAPAGLIAFAAVELVVIVVLILLLVFLK